MHIKPYLGGEIGRGKSGFAVNRGAVNRGFTVYTLHLCLTSGLGELFLDLLNLKNALSIKENRAC